MPFASRKQQAWAHTPNGTKALGGASAVREWDQATNESTLPTYAPKRQPGALLKKKKYLPQGVSSGF